MRSVLAFLLVPLMVVAALPSQLNVSGPNQGITLYCLGTGCAAWGTPVLDLSNSTNWTLHLRIKFDPLLGDSDHDLFSQSTLVGGAFTCAGVFIRDTKSGGSFPVSVRVTIAGGIGSSTILTGGTNLALGTWYTIDVTHDSSHNWTIYLNGVSDGTTNSSVTTGTGCDTFIGTISGATSCGSSGLDVGCWINDAAMFPAVLPLTDIKALSSGTRPNLVSTKPSVWYPMDGVCSGASAPGTPLADMSGNQHTAKMGLDPAPDYCAVSTAETNGNVNPDTGEATH